MSLLSPRGSRRRAEAVEAAETDEAKMPGTPAVTTVLEAEEASPGTGRDPDILTGVTSAHDAAAGTGSAGAEAAVGRRGARAFLRGSHRTVLTVAAVTGVVLVAGVLVGLRGGGAAHDTATPDAAASVLDPESGSGSRGGLPGALPLPSGHTSGPTPDGTSAGHVGKGDSAGGKDTGSGSGKADSHGAPSGSHGASSGSHDDGKGDSTSSSSAGDQPAAQQTQAAHSTTHSTAPAAPAGSSAPSVSGVEVYSHDSNRCITVVGGQGKDGSPLEIRDCTGSAAQKWTIRSDGTIRAFGLCMDLAGASTANGTVIQLAYCNGGPAQRFDLNFRHDLVNVPADKCVDVTDAQTANGTRLQLWNCNGHDNQKWSKR
ncbi:ricin-type beta-trefoil lectin domain protein [Streptomyces sp. NPDC048521]|uniref:ricin-type beta-trefoil lectin domain protein n=1 Tax=Streptomyces sp. NPDC048521 TaxID=3365566 RepID=UPI0037147F27